MPKYLDDVFEGFGSPPTEKKNTFVPNEYQKAVFEWIREGTGHAIVEAVAGSGKTTTIVEAAQYISGSGVFVAFNKKIADELKSRLLWSDMQASTLHSLGLRMLRKKHRNARVNGDKYRNEFTSICSSGMFGGRIISESEKKSLSWGTSFDILKLLDLLRQHIVDPLDENFESRVSHLVGYYLLDIDPELMRFACDITKHLLVWGRAQTKEIDFTDMVWIPVVEDLTIRSFDWAFVDEAQDLSPLQVELVCRVITTNGRMMFVGDRLQAIYGFAGADGFALQRLQETLDPTLLPLSVCYRCPHTVLALAREYCPQMEAAPGAVEGAVHRLPISRMVQMAREHDMVISRKNSSLMPVALRLIQYEHNVTIKGQNIGKILLRVARNLSRIAHYEDFLSSITWWENEEVKKLETLENQEQKIDFVRDQAQCLRVLAKYASDYTQLFTTLETLFAKKDRGIELSTIHKAKGLEAERVFIIGALTSPGPCKNWMLEQEQNIAYVALTRASRELIFVPED